MRRKLWAWTGWFTLLLLLNFIVPFWVLQDKPTLGGSFLFWILWIVVAITSMFVIFLRWREPDTNSIGRSDE